MADTTEKFTCIDCGKEVEYEGGLAGWAKKNPDKVRCKECFDKHKSGYAKKGTASTTAKAPAKGSGKSAETSGKKPIDAKMFKQAFDELRAEFADDLDSVKDYLGGWTSTLVINRSK